MFHVLQFKQLNKTTQQEDKQIHNKTHKRILKLHNPRINNIKGIY